MYTFNSHKVFVPLMIGALMVIFLRQLWLQKIRVLIFLAGCLLLLAPLLWYSRTREAQLRFNEVSWVNDLAPLELSNKRISEDNNSVMAKIVHNRRVVYSLEFLKHYLDTFNPDFLFFKGDANFRLSIQTVGELYLVDLPFLLAGMYFLIKNKNKSSAVLFSWALLAPIPEALARETPHALRMLNILPVPQIIIAYGLWHLIKSKRFASVLVGLFYILVFSFYLKNYYLDYPKNFASSWQYGYKQMVQYVLANQTKYDQIKVTDYYGRPYIYFLFYSQYPPQKYWSTVKIDRDWYGFWYVHGFDKYVFDDTIPVTGKVLYIREPQVIPGSGRLVKTILDLDNQPVFKIWE